MFKKLALFVLFLSVMGISIPSTLRADGCVFSPSQPSAKLVYGDLSNCGNVSNNWIQFTVKNSNGTIIDNGKINGTHGGWEFGSSYGSNGSICVSGFANGQQIGSEQCYTVGSPSQSQPPPPQATSPPPANNGGGGNPQPNPDVPFVGQQNQPSSNWVQAQAEPLYVYNGQSTSSQIIAKVHAGMYLTLSGTSNGWTQVFVNGGIGYVQDGNGLSNRNVGTSQPSGGNPPTNNSDSQYGQARLGDGGLDVAAICRVTGQSATNDGQHAYSWGCNGNILNKDATCAQVWPEYPYARVVGGLAGWSCHSSPQTQEQPSSNNSGNNGGNSGGSNSGSGASNSNPPPLVVGCPLSTRLHVGGEGQVIVPNLTFRNGAGTDKGYVLTMQKGDVFSVVGGPTCTGGRNWFSITFLDKSGWIAEGGDSGYFTQPITTAQPPPNPPPVKDNIFSRADSRIKSMIATLKSYIPSISEEELWSALYDTWGIVVPCGLTVAAFSDSFKQAKLTAGPDVLGFIGLFGFNLVVNLGSSDAGECVASLGTTFLQPLKSLVQ